MMSMANNCQILAFLSFLPIGNECAKLAFRRGHELFQKQTALAIFPMKRAKYCALQRKDVFPEPFRGNKPHISVFAGLSGLSWAQPTVPYLTPVLSVGQISLLLRPSLYAPHNTVMIRPTLLVTRHRRLRREEIGWMSRVPTKFEERDKNFSLRGGFNTTKNGKFLS